jgi:hypothetical protein
MPGNLANAVRTVAVPAASIASRVGVFCYTVTGSS